MTVSLDFAAWLVTRLWVIFTGLGALPYPAPEGLFADVRLYAWWAGNIADGHFPINDPMWQYPPLAAALFALSYALAPGIAGFVTLALVADYATFAALRRAGRRAGTTLPVWIWILTAVAMGPIVLGRFDVFPTALVVAALLAPSGAGRGAQRACPPDRAAKPGDPARSMARTRARCKP